MEYIFITGTKLCITFIITAEPLNKGHLGTHSFLSLNIVLNGEVSSFQRFKLHSIGPRNLFSYRGFLYCVLNTESPLSEVQLYFNKCDKVDLTTMFCH